MRKALLLSSVPRQVNAISCPSNRDRDCRGISLALAAALGSKNLLLYVRSLISPYAAVRGTRVSLFLICLAYALPVLSSFWTQTQRFLLAAYFSVY